MHDRWARIDNVRRLRYFVSWACSRVSGMWSIVTMKKIKYNGVLYDTIREACDALKVNRWTMKTAIKTGYIFGKKISVISEFEDLEPEKKPTKKRPVKLSTGRREPLMRFIIKHGLGY
jgi:hypothetical protein